jgi:hypothetical protein
LEAVELEGDGVDSSSPWPTPEQGLDHSTLVGLKHLFPGEELRDMVLVPGFLDAEKEPPSVLGARVVAEPSTDVLILMGLAIFVVTQRVVPVNLRSVHSRLRARRDQAPIR